MHSLEFRSSVFVSKCCQLKKLYSFFCILKYFFNQTLHVIQIWILRLKLISLFWVKAQHLDLPCLRLNLIILLDSNLIYSIISINILRYLAPSTCTGWWSGTGVLRRGLPGDPDPLRQQLPEEDHHVIDIRKIQAILETWPSWARKTLRLILLTMLTNSASYPLWRWPVHLHQGYQFKITVWSVLYSQEQKLEKYVNVSVWCILWPFLINLP